MDILPLELQRIIHQLLHKICMEEVMADMLYSMDKKNINRGNIYSDLIHKMMNNEPYEPLENYRDYNCSQSKIAKEVHRQYFIDSGKYTLEQIDILEPF